MWSWEGGTTLHTPAISRAKEEQVRGKMAREEKLLCHNRRGRAESLNEMSRDPLGEDISGPISQQLGLARAGLEPWLEPWLEPRRDSIFPGAAASPRPPPSRHIPPRLVTPCATDACPTPPAPLTLAYENESANQGRVRPRSRGLTPRPRPMLIDDTGVGQGRGAGGHRSPRTDCRQQALPGGHRQVERGAEQSVAVPRSKALRPDLECKAP